MKCKCGCGKDIIFKTWHKYYRHDFLKGHRPSRKTKVIICDTCGKKFRHLFISCPSQQHFKHHYCSRKCTGLGKRTTVKCDFCGKDFFKQPYRISRSKHNFCSHQCFKQFNIHKNHPNWKGGKRIENGYYVVYSPKHPNSYKGYMLEHRLVLEKKLGRYLHSNEIAHHNNGNKLDNRPQNISLHNRSSHAKYHKQLQLSTI